METNLKTFLDSLRVGSVVFWLYNFGSLETKTKRIENYNQSNVRINRVFSFSDGQFVSSATQEKSRPSNQETRKSLTINFQCQSMWSTKRFLNIYLFLKCKNENNFPREASSSWFFTKTLNDHFWVVVIHNFFVIQRYKVGMRV